MSEQLQSQGTKAGWLTKEVWKQPVNVSGGLGPVAIALASVIMLWWSWGTWPDVLFDFGRELYLAWQLATGKTLYTDLAHFKGPLSHYLNALWYHLFGTSLRTLVLCNLAILACLITLIYQLLVKISDRLSTTVACLVFVTLFAFSQLVDCGNYNYVCPYSPEVTHGVTLSMSSIYCLAQYLRVRRRIFLAGAGLSLGLTLLTDAQVFIAAGAAVITGLALALWTEPPERRRLGVSLGTFFAGLVVPLAVALGLLCLVLPVRLALEGVLGAFPSLLNRGYVSQKFYLSGMGLLNVGTKVETMLEWTVWYVLIFGSATVFSFMLPKPKSWRIALSGTLFLIIVCAFRARTIKWEDAFRPLPFVMVALGVVWLAIFLRRRRQAAISGRAIICLMMIIFGSVLLGKMILHARIIHYGFAMAMPATLLLVVALVGWVPDWLNRQDHHGGLFRAVAFAIITATTFAYLEQTSWWFGMKIDSVSSGGDAFRSDRLGTAMQTTLDEINRRLEPSQTLAVLPEGAMLNYLSRRVNPTPHTIFTPGVLTALGEDRILSAFQTHPPDYIVLVHRDTSEYGFQFFGRDYGQHLFGWIRANYRDVWLFGSQPLRDKHFGILLLKRKEGLTSVLLN